MRKMLRNNRTLGSIHISEIEFDLNCRHEIIPILLALQCIYGKPKLLKKILKVIEEDILKVNEKNKIEKKNANRGAPGLDYWEILVLASVRHGCNLDYDALHDLANNHRKLRQMLNLGEMDLKQYSRSSLQENIAKISDKTIEQISQLIIEEGHKISPKAIEKVRGDSFVVQTNIHYPTDANLILDGIRKMLALVNDLANILSIVGWRKHDYLWVRARKTNRKIQRIASSKKKNRVEKLQELYLEYIKFALEIIERCKATITTSNRMKKDALIDFLIIKPLIKELKSYIELTEKVCDLAYRRVICDETIPHNEKIFSLFEPHTELINRGKVPYPIEFGHRVLIIQDKAGFILKYQIMDHITDDKVVVPAMKELQERYGDKIQSASFDRGFYTPANRTELEKILALICLPKKGNHSQEDREREGSPEFLNARKRHPGIESCIHALGAGNGLVLCRDKKEKGYRRYVALGVLGRNLQVLGTILLKKAKKKQKRKLKAA